MAKNEDQDWQIVTLESVRVRYESVYEARPRDEDKPDKVSFGITILADNRRHGAILDHIDDLTERVALDEFKKKVVLKNRPVKDGNEKSDVDGFGDGISFLNAYRQTRPGVVDRELDPTAEGDEQAIYAGCIANVTVRLFAYDHKTGGKGVTCELIAVQFVAHGERFTNGVSTDAKRYFKPLDGGSGGGSERGGRGGRSSGRGRDDEDATEDEDRDNRGRGSDRGGRGNGGGYDRGGGGYDRGGRGRGDGGGRRVDLSGF